MPRKIVLVGLGFHARHHYLHLLADLVRRQEVRLVAVVELEKRRAHTAQVLSDAGIPAAHFVGVRATDALAQAEALANLSRVKAQHGCDGLIISTDPRNHLPYLEWGAVEGVDVLVDKPLTATDMDFSPESARALTNAFESVRDLFAKSAATATVMVTRRSHDGYLIARRVLHEVAAEFGIPITFINAYHANGYWNFPDEFRSRENHPYKYGFGALLHGGYHVVDLAAWLLSVNENALRDDWADSVEVLTQHTTPDDFLEQVPEAVYSRLGLGQSMQAPFSSAGRRFARSCGETDVNIAFSARRNDRVITMGNIQVMETALSTRAWRDLPEDTYKSNGRHSQERLTIHMGHLLTLHTEDYRSWSGDADPDGLAPARFVIRVLRNSKLIGGEPYSEHVLTRPPNPAGHRDESLTERSRRQAFHQWIAGTGHASALDTHGLSIRLLTAAHESMFRRRRGLAPMATFPMRTPTLTQEPESVRWGNANV
ncbi:MULTISPECIES: Gfo/Idh/MocA family oxidoreductase [unclassified Streptomyces]|uniref:Gfo/Idh/MocA family protein n=1 Tax=unclassified Streptomyces TaxID=2593676 RepID=UPI002365226F|nr:MULTISPECIES: Gfo/Idh/MocA family oxidoreductase [unclassified Streptomyces]MDF3139854.1 Gfo/Idh/MocA family oxidoreductase [Streptomyces sp. T21Q-yed]WDF41912.1 Gfo/Idh/MocA family oxidoreductase [Streptomyces sp. T12]